MKHTTNHKRMPALSAWALPAAATLLLGAGSALAQQPAVAVAAGVSAGAQGKAQAKSESSGQSKGGKSESKSASSGKLSVVSRENVEGDDDDGIKGEAIEVRVEDGKITVKRNGKEVPADHIKRGEDGSITIIGEDGKETVTGLKALLGAKGLGHALQLGEGGNLFRLGNGDGEGEMRWTTVNGEGEQPKVMLGIHMGETGPALEKHLSLEPGKTIMITGVLEGLPAEQAGLGEYDIIIAVNGEPNAEAGVIHRALADAKPGDTIVLKVIQAGKKKDVKIAVAAYDAKKMSSAKVIGKEADNDLLGALEPFKGMHLDLGKWQNLGDLKGGHVFVAPGDDGKLWDRSWELIAPKLQNLEPKLQEMQPMIEQHLQDALKKYVEAQEKAGASGGNARDVEAQLNRLDDRMSQLEKLLQKLIEQRQKP